MRVAAYVDGFNLYYGLFRGQGHVSAAYKWLDIIRLTELTAIRRGIQNPNVVAVRYCTSQSLPTRTDPNQPARQAQLWSALRSDSRVSLIQGLHVERSSTVCAYGQDGKPQDKPFKASRREEKGSDVNVAAYLLRDAAKNEFDIAMVFSDDSDLENAIKLATVDFGKEVWVVSPAFRRTKPTLVLQRASSRYFRVDVSLLSQCVLPDPIIDSQGTVVARKPKEWV
jgi:hypothetical protein